MIKDSLTEKREECRAAQKRIEERYLDIIAREKARLLEIFHNEACFEAAAKYHGCKVCVLKFGHSYVQGLVTGVKTPASGSSPDTLFTLVLDDDREVNITPDTKIFIRSF